jgi:hypothetical protein
MLNVFPCVNKVPLVSDWPTAAKPYEAWPEPGQVEEWGCPTGPANGFWVLDVDKKSGGLDTLAALTLPTTQCFDTRNGGKHFYFRWPANVPIRNRAGVLPGIDVRGDGGYVVLYGEPNTAEMCEAPQWLLDLIARPNKPVALDLHGEVGEGGRNHYLTSAAGRMQKLGVLTLAALTELNESKCNPPLDDAEVAAVFHSVSRYAPDSTPSEEAPPPSIVWAKDLAKAMVAYLSDKDLVRGEPTGLEELDHLFGGGKRLGEVTVTLAEAKTGKNTFWHFLMIDWLKRGMPVGYASRELSPEIEVLPNLITLALGRNAYTDSPTEEEAAGVLSQWNLAFAPGYGPILKEEMWAWLDACRASGVSYFFIDHLHYCLHDPEDFKGISVFIRDLKAYARKHSVHIDLIVQPKLQEQGQRLSLNSLRGGAAIGQALDNLVTMQRERDSEGKLTNVVKVTMEVARSKLARLGSFFLDYNRDTMTFQVVEPVAEPEEQLVDDDVPVFDRSRSASPIRPVNGAALAQGISARMKDKRLS